MELITKGVLVHNLNNVEVFSIKVNDTNYKIVRKRLEYELNKIIKTLNTMKEQGEIKSTSKPRNKKMQKTLNDIVRIKKQIKNSISNISELYYK